MIYQIAGDSIIIFREFIRNGNVNETIIQEFVGIYFVKFGGGRLVGVGKKDATGKPISLETDARPIVLGLICRKLVFKATFALDRAGIRERLGDQQLALTKNGAEIMVHAVRAWVQQNRGDSYIVLLQNIRDAFNEARPSELLRDCRNHAPVSARFAHYVYGQNRHLVYADQLPACQRGQQGCPMMGPMLYLTRRRMFEAARNQTSRPAPSLKLNLQTTPIRRARFQMS